MMAGNAGTIKFEPAETQFTEKSYEKQWIIPNWHKIQRSEDAVTCQTFQFETGNSSELKTKWILGFKKFGDQPGNFHLYWKLADAKGFQDGKVHVTLNSSLLKGDSTVCETYTQEKTLSLGEMVDGPIAFHLNTNWNDYINSDGELVFKFKLVVMEPEVPSADLQINLFQKHCVVQVYGNFVRLLGDKATADLKIVTRDGKELFAHKLILQAQCPVFESMFQSNMSVNKTGIVNVKDVTAKTMGIFLGLFYLGKLHPSWKDPDNVVDFTSAAGKYQVTNLLKLLDKVIGSRDEEDATHVDVQLLDLARKLDLKTAEKELIDRLRKTMAKMESGGEFFALWGEGMVS